MSEDIQPPRHTMGALAQQTWFKDRDKSSIFVAAYRALHADNIQLKTGAVIFDFDRVRAILAYGILNYIDPSGTKIKFDSESNATIEISIENAKTEEGSHLILITPYDLDGVPGNEAEARSRIKSTVGLLTALHGRNIAYRVVFENVVGVGDDKTTVVSPIFENPNWFPKVDMAADKIALTSIVGQKVALLEEARRTRIELSLRWFENALYDMGVDAFLKYWIAIETLGMPDTSDIRPLNELPSAAYSVSSDDVKHLFKIGRIFGLRSRIVHDGQIIPFHAQLGRYVEALYVDLLLAILDLPSERRLERVLAQKGFDLNSYLYEA